MNNVSEILKWVACLGVIVLFLMFLGWATASNPLPAGIVQQKWYDEGRYYFSVNGEVGSVSARTYHRVREGGWYDGKR